MIGEIKTIEIGDTSYELKKQGVNFSLTVQSIFLELMIKNGLNPDLPDSQLEMALMAGMRGDILNDVKTVIQRAVHVPKITDDTYEDLGFNTIPKLFLQIYMFQIGSAEKKSENTSEFQDTQTKITAEIN